MFVVLQAAKFANRLVDSQAHELDAMRMELDKVKAELAAAKDGAVTKEVATWRSKYDVERAASLAARREVGVLTAKMAEEAGRAKKWKETEIARFGKSRERLETRCTRAIARHDEILATCNLRSEKTRQFVEQQPLIRRAMYGVNQIVGVLEAVETWRAEGIVIPAGKVDYLKRELEERKKKAGELVPIKYSDDELSVIPAFDFGAPLAAEVGDATLGRERTSRRRDEGARCEGVAPRHRDKGVRRHSVERRPATRDATRRDVGARSSQA